MATPKVDIKLNKVDRVYSEGELVKGFIRVDSPEKLVHAGVSLQVVGQVRLQLSAKSVGLFEAFYSSVKPIDLMAVEKALRGPEKVAAGVSQIPFEFPIEALEGRRLYNTYHGLYCSITYTIKVAISLKGGWSGKKVLSRDLEFIVECKSPRAEDADGSEGGSVKFAISPESLQNVAADQKLPNFRITGKIQRRACPLNLPFTGELVVEKTEVGIKAINLQLVRVESVIFAEGEAREATEIQSIQIVSGDLCRKLVVPIYMIFPRLYTCPSLVTKKFSIEFEVNLIVVLEDDHVITENFPITIYKE
jgi:hypothetical protein